MSLKLFFVLCLAVCGANALRLNYAPRAATDAQVSELAESLENLIVALDGKDLDAASDLGVDISLAADVFLPTATKDIADYNSGDSSSIICYADTALDKGILQTILDAMDTWISLVADIDFYTSQLANCGVVDDSPLAIAECKEDLIEELSGPAQTKATELNTLLDPVTAEFDTLELCLAN